MKPEDNRPAASVQQPQAPHPMLVPSELTGLATASPTGAFTDLRQGCSLVLQVLLFPAMKPEDNRPAASVQPPAAAEAPPAAVSGTGTLAQ